MKAVKRQMKGKLVGRSTAKDAEVDKEGPAVPAVGNDERDSAVEAASLF